MRGIKPISYTRESKEKRRNDLIQATIDIIIEKGLHSVVIRDVAERAGVTNGLVRHYFESKDNLLRETYREVMQRMTRAVNSALLKAGDNPRFQLRAFVMANQTAPVLDIRNLSVWASFISLVHVDPALAKIHREHYLTFRHILENVLLKMFIDLNTPIDKQQAVNYAVKINAIIDGLWLEGCLASDLFADDELTRSSIEAVEAVLGITLDD